MREGDAQVMRMWANERPVFSLAFLVVFLLPSSHPPLITTLLFCLVGNKLESIKEIGTPSLVLSVMCMSSSPSCPRASLVLHFSSPSRSLFSSLSHFHSLLFVCLLSYIVVVIHTLYFGDPGPPWRAARVCHLSSSSLLHPFFFLLSTFCLFTILIQACSLSRNQ